MPVEHPVISTAFDALTALLRSLDAQAIAGANPPLAYPRYLDTVRYMNTTLPPGPPYPRALQSLGWGVRPMPFMERCHERYGDIFTLKIAHEGTWVLLAHPDMVKQVFTGDPKVFHAGEGNVDPASARGQQLRAHPRRRRPHGPAQAAAPAVPRRADAELRRPAHRDRRPRGGELGHRHALPPLAADAGDHARGDPARRVRAGGGRAPGGAAHAASARCSRRAPTPPRWCCSAFSGPTA